MSKGNHRRHLWLMLLCCLIPMAALAAIAVFRVPAGRVLTAALVLVCPLGHLLMMRSMFQKHEGSGRAEESGHEGHCQPAAEGSSGAAAGKP